ncbi:hypothetical protein MTO96_042003 [Rhipicephalus appendiculatus]
MNCRKFIEILSALVLISGVSSNTQSEDGKAKENHPVCRSQQCIQRGKLLKEFIDGDKDPCGDFFSYACGGWIKTHEKKQQPYDVFQYVRSGFTEDMAEILAQTGPSDTTSSVTLKAAKLYKACMDESKRVNAEDFLQAASDYKDVLKIGLGPILSYFVARGATEVNKHVIKIFMLSIMNAATKERVKAAVKFMNEKITDDDAETISTKLEEFERKLLQATVECGRWFLSSFDYGAFRRARSPAANLRRGRVPRKPNPPRSCKFAWRSARGRRDERTSPHRLRLLLYFLLVC